MPEITRDEVAHLANLARIDLDDAELDHLAPQLSVILESVASINGVAGDDVPPTSHALPLTNVFRDDVVTPGLTAEQALVRCPRGRAAALQRPADPGGRAVMHRDSAAPPPRWPQALADGSVTTRRSSPRPTSTASTPSTAPSTPSCTSTREGALAQAAASDARRAAGEPAQPARRRADRGQGRAGHRGTAHDVRLEDPRGLDPAVRRDRRRAAAALPACRSSARPTWTSSRWAPPPSTRPTAPRTTRGTSTASPAAPAAARPPPWPPSRRRWPSAPTPAARSASPARSPARSA